MNESLTYTFLAIAITINSITGLVNDTLANLLVRRVCKVNPGNIFNKFLNSDYKDDVLFFLKRLMILEIIWSILQLFGYLSLQGKAVCMAILLFIPQIIIILVYLCIFWFVGIDFAWKRFQRKEKKEMVKISFWLLLFILAEPLLPMLADVSIVQINKVKQNALPEISREYALKENAKTSIEDISQIQKDKALENAKYLRQKFKIQK
jgi:hypothetical protein